MIADKPTHGHSNHGLSVGIWRTSQVSKMLVVNLEYVIALSVISG